MNYTALVVALTGLVSAVTGLIALFRKVSQVHTLVNASATEARVRNEQLTAAMTAAGLVVPPAPAVPPAKPEPRPSGGHL